MSNETNPQISTTPVDMINTLTSINARAAATVQAAQKSIIKQLDPQAAQISLQPMLKAFTATAEAMARDPHTLLQRNLELHQSYLALTASFLERMLGRDAQPVVMPEKGDTRFADPAWNDSWYDLLKQSYLLTSQWLMNTIDSTKGLDKHTHMQAKFYTRQFVEMMSPSNFLPTNPEAINTALATHGESLLKGFQNIMSDIQQGRISTTDKSQFTVGGNIGVTPGKVVFRNHLFELIQYSPSAEAKGKVKQIPLLISPPWINRFYILDLKPKNSFIKYMTDQGFQVFIISWKNPDASYRDVSFENYITDGIIPAIDTTLAVTGAETVNTIGYCIGGTLLASAMAALNVKAKGGVDKRINSATFFTTLVDFSEAGELKVFIDEEQVTRLEQKMAKDGVLDGAEMAGTFSALRANDMVWNYVVNNYLLGKQPFPFDILYWNQDSTRMPYAMHSWYLRNLYLENNLVQPGKLKLLNTPIDLANIKQPLYMVSAENDHITPWASCYNGYQNMGSDEKRFILSKAGHVAGVVNPPTEPGKPVKRAYWAADAKAKTADMWKTTAKETPDSWWTDYVVWLAERSGPEVAAPKTMGSSTYKPLADAPGTYVLE